MDQASFRLLLTPSGQEALQAAEALEPREKDFLRDFTQLSRKVPVDLARAALETAILRREAAGKFPFAGQMYFTAEALEQASGYEISSYRAERYRPFQKIVDLGCSIGGDSLALAGIAPCLGIDLDLLRLDIAKANLNALSLGSNTAFIRADLAVSLPLVPAVNRTALFFDPARRAAGRRIFSVQDYLPPLASVLDWLPRFPALGVKISPGVNLAELSGFDAEIEFISVKGELKEAALWFGPLKTAKLRATLLPGPHSLIASAKMPQLAVDSPRAFLYEPDPAILRAGLVSVLGNQLEAVQLDPDIAYLTAEKQKPTPFARVWAVEDWFPFGLKRLRAYLRQRDVGHVTVKKRGSPLQPEALIHDLHLKGEQERVIFLTHLRGRPIIILCFERSAEQGLVDSGKPNL